MTRVISACEIAHKYGGEQVLAGLDFDVEQGERVAILGANGAGKTTLLRILACAMRPSRGQLQLFGRDALRDRETARRRLGFVAHSPGLYGELTVLENLKFFCALHGVPRTNASAALARLEIDALAVKPASRLSRGQQQRVALARSLVHEPDLWVLDEPDASLDRAGAELVGRLATGRTVVLATHDRAFAERVCNRIHDLRDGALFERTAHLEVVG